MILSCTWLQQNTNLPQKGQNHSQTNTIFAVLQFFNVKPSNKNKKHILTSVCSNSGFKTKYDLIFVSSWSTVLLTNMVPVDKYSSVSFQPNFQDLKHAY